MHEREDRDKLTAKRDTLKAELDDQEKAIAHAVEREMLRLKDDNQRLRAEVAEARDQSQRNAIRASATKLQLGANMFADLKRQLTELREAAKAVRHHIESDSALTEKDAAYKGLCTALDQLTTSGSQAASADPLS